jgi:hypothetical protein
MPVTPDLFRGPTIREHYRLRHVGCRNQSGMTQEAHPPIRNTLAPAQRVPYLFTDESSRALP